ncbi:MAG: ECF transporter S component [Treponema sp.]|nr:ECF transporter S component [Spirochaetaceae bacterium]MBQ6782108.1 ECF transporter S component [Treponema sp.]
MISEKNRKIAITGAFSALVVVMYLTGLGYIRINPQISYTILQVPVILATILGGLVPGLITGFVFGLTSLIKSAVMPLSMLDPYFLNPLCSIFPRVMIAVVTWLVFTALKKIPHLPVVVSGIVAAVLGSLTNTIMVFAMLCLIYFSEIAPIVQKAVEKFPYLGNAAYFAILLMFAPAALVEGAISGAVSGAVLTSMGIASRGKAKLNKDSEE